MKRIGIIGLCFVGVLAFSAMVASSASATPQFYHCKNETNTASLLATGPFENKAKCETLTGPNTGTWWFSEYKGTEETEIKGLALLGQLIGNAVGLGVKITCEDGTFKGRINAGNGSMLVSKIVVNYFSCKIANSNTACTTTGKAAGEIETKEIMGTLGSTVNGGGGATQVGIVFESEVADSGGGLSFAKFTCSGLPEVVVTGKVVGLLPEKDSAGVIQIGTAAKPVKRSAWELRFECEPAGSTNQRHQSLLLLPANFVSGLTLTAFAKPSCLEDVVHITSPEVGEIMA